MSWLLGLGLFIWSPKLYHQCKKEDWSKDLVSQFPTYEEYRKRGIGGVLLLHYELKSGVFEDRANGYAIVMFLDWRIPG